MNSFGFVLDLPGPTTQGGGSTSSINTVPGLDGPIFEVKQLSDPSSDADAILERYGLTKKLIDKFNGQLVIDNLRSILLSIEDEGLALNIRIALSEGLLLWHRTISEDVTQSALNTVYYKIIEMIRFILADPDGSNLTSTAQRAAYNMSLVLNRQVISTPAFRQTVYADVLRALQYVVDQNIVLSELCPEEDAPHIRCTSLRLLLQCLPVEVENIEELKSVIALLMKVSNAASNAQNLQQFIAEQIGALRLDDDDILTPYVGSLVSLVEKGHKEAFGALKKCKKFFDANSKELEENLDKLLDVVGFDELGDKIQEIMDIDVKKLFNSVPALCKQLGQTVVKHKMVILGVLLAIALVSAAVLVPFIAPIGMACLSNPEIFIALFKVLSVVGKYSDDAARAALQIFAQIARSNAELEGHIQRALLDAVNIVKDKSQYCNIFKPETMQAFEKLSRANPEAYANIVAWNTGKKARIGDTKKYLMKAGETPTKASGAAAAINGVGLLALFSGSKEKKKKNLVSPSPQSQSMHVSTEVQQNLHINVPPTPSVSTPGVFAVLPPTPDTRGSVRIERDLFGANPGTSLPAMTASGKQESLAEFMVRQKWEKEMGILPKQTSTAISTASTASSTTQGNPTGSFKSAVDIMAPINYTPYSPLDESILPPQSVRAQVINDGVSHLLSTVPEETEVSVVGKESHMVAAESTAAKFTPVKSKGILLSWFFSSSKKKVGVAAQQKVSKNTLSQPSAEYKPGYKIVQSSSGINTVVLASGKHSLRPTNNVASYNNTNTNASSDWASSPISSNQLSNGTFAPPTPEDEIRALRQRLAMLEAQRGQPPGHQ